MDEAPNIQKLKCTPLHCLYAQYGAKVAPFAGFELPLSFDGVISEHLATRASAGLFDVSHMGIVDLIPRNGESQDAISRALERISPAGIADLGNDRLQYALFTNEQGGVVDDFIVSRNESRIRLVLNASRTDADLAYIQSALVGISEITLREDLVQLALQGPEAVAILAPFHRGVAELGFMQSGRFHIDGIDCEVSRSGYTGEDGFEIIVDSENALNVASALLKHNGVTFCGLGARDSLRLEAGLCLYGNDLDETTTPIEARLAWTIPKRRREDAAFAGSQVILDQIAAGTQRTRVGISSLTKRPIREGSILFDEEGLEVGIVTSGGFGPSCEAPVAMGYINAGVVDDSSRLVAHARDKEFPCQIAALPFVQHKYKRN
tara:strand:+ start:25834 stop:26967 length:1134 start_codon:yes stop_codon:yes gene_type:complete